MAADTPTSVRIRAYDVGFGDCFLVTFAYPSTERHVLIDFGSFPPPTRKTAGNMPAIAEHIRATCKGALTAVVATHRHADHITGFTTRKGKGPGDVIRACKPQVVVQPWTEDPKLAADAPGPKGLLPADRSHVSALADMVRFREALLPRIADLPPGWQGVRRELEFLVKNGVSNAPAVDNLGSMAPKGGQRYVYFGAESGLGAVLPGVKVRVLGPPTISQSAAVEAERSRDAAEFWEILAASAEYWQILAATAESGAGADGPRFATRYRSKAGIPGFARWLVTHADAVVRQQVLSIVRRMDDYMNNTSVILLFEVGGKKFLFPGDAQIENWSYALSKPEIPALLSGVDVYKVGHHGSRNATPKAGLWEHFAKRNKASGRLVTFLSTEPGHHGTAKNHTEVPRTTLAKALESETELYSTNAAKTLTKERGVAFIEHTVPLGGSGYRSKDRQRILPAPAPAKDLTVAFEGAVVSVHVFVDEKEVSLVSVSGGKWKGNEKRVLASPRTTAKLAFTAPVGTDYTLTIKCDGKKIVDDDGSSDAPRFSKPYQVIIPSASPLRLRAAAPRRR